ncbi:glycosyltransferase [Williamsia sp. 1135]|uniref:glycosyltransferase n=1 Tax=Williamsia sp. 1135 TaxID=1889262 RepID=UPI00143B86AD|nr:glycosyltransferase [Williamsia sp. 1135]
MKFAPFAYIWARLNRAPLIVDAFVGIYETKIDDWNAHRTDSLRAQLYKLQDFLAYRAADLILIDNSYRASRLVERVAGIRVVDLPVGAPVWCSEVRATAPATGQIRVLFYGNFLPLHGAEVLIDSIALLGNEVNISLTLIGGGPRREIVMQQAADLGILDRCEFRDPVPESELGMFIDDAQIVCGVFGTSEKAESVIPNKVWQGLASGRLVVTRESPALDELMPIVPKQIVQVPAGDAAALAESFTSIYRAGEYGVYFADANEELNSFVASRFAFFDVSENIVRRVRPLKSSRS